MSSEGKVQEDARPGSRETAVLLPGRNCRHVAIARRATLLIDAESYFAQLERALHSAKRSIFIIGWDFDARIQLRPQDGPDALALGDLLRRLVERNPDLEIRILVWSLAPIHAPGAAAALVFGAEWQEHPRIHLRLDSDHPVHAAHHQKMVVIDDSLIFLGGIDLTVERWDTSRHALDEPHRVYPDGEPYEPVHDVQMVVDGPAARLVAQVAHERWQNFTGTDVALDDPVELWPDSVTPGFENVPMGLSRTVPAFGARKAVEESGALTQDLLRSARRTIYIESQYFTARYLRRVLGEILARSDPPEIVLIVPLNANGFVERFIMGANRERLVRSLAKVDHAKRLRLFYPVIGKGPDLRRILVHAKLIIIDDRVMRIGSSNLNNRSVGLDTECDLAVEADRPQTRSAITEYRNRLLAEHLNVDPARLGDEIRRQGSLIAALETLNGGERCLRPLIVTSGPTHSFPGTRLLDPERPFGFIEKLRAWWYRRPAQDGPVGRDAPESERRTSDENSRMLPRKSGSRK